MENLRNWIIRPWFWWLLLLIFYFIITQLSWTFCILVDMFRWCTLLYKMLYNFWRFYECSERIRYNWLFAILIWIQTYPGPLWQPQVGLNAELQDLKFFTSATERSLQDRWYLTFSSHLIYDTLTSTTCGDWGDTSICFHHCRSNIAVPIGLTPQNHFHNSSSTHDRVLWLRSVGDPPGLVRMPQGQSDRFSPRSPTPQDRFHLSSSTTLPRVRGLWLRRCGRHSRLVRPPQGQSDRLSPSGQSYR